MFLGGLPSRLQTSPRLDTVPRHIEYGVRWLPRTTVLGRGVAGGTYLATRQVLSVRMRLEDDFYQCLQMPVLVVDDFYQ